MRIQSLAVWSPYQFPKEVILPPYGLCEAAIFVGCTRILREKECSNLLFMRAELYAMKHRLRGNARTPKKRHVKQLELRIVNTLNLNG